MHKALDSIGHRSKKELKAKQGLLCEKNLLPPESKLNQLNVELIFFLPLSGDAAAMTFHYSNPLWLDCIKYDLEEIQRMGNHFFAELFHESDQFIIRRVIRELSCAGPDKVITTTFTMNCKDKTVLTTVSAFMVSVWHFAGKPKLIACCGTILSQNFRDPIQMQAFLNRNAHSKKVEKARRLKKELFDVLKLIHQKKSNKDIADELFISVSCVKGRKFQLIKALEFACYRDLVNFVFESSLFY